MASPQSPLTCMSWAEFEACPELLYGLVTSSGGGAARFQYDPSKVNVMSTNLTDDKRQHNRILYAETVEELEAAKRELKSRPMLMIVATRFTHTESYLVVRVTTNFKGTFALLVNPAHSMISSVIDAKFEEAKECLLQGRKYCIELNFNPAVARWYKDMVDEGNMMRISETAVCKYGRVYVTNHTPYEHCFDCNKIWCVLCGPCWLLSAPCYMIHRNQKCKDFRYHFKETPVALRTALNSGQAADIFGVTSATGGAVVVQSRAEPVVQAQPAHNTDHSHYLLTQPPPYNGAPQQQMGQSADWRGEAPPKYEV